MANEGWGSRASAGRERQRRVWLRRGAWTAVVAGLAGALLWLVLKPLYHPRTQLVLLTGDVVGTDAAALGVPSDYVVDDFRALLRLEGALQKSVFGDSGPLVLGSLRSPDEMQDLAGRLNERLTGSHDAVIVYVSAHGIVQDGDTWLLASGADQNAPLAGRYRLANLLAQLRECRAATKLLVLDAGRIEYDPLRGLLDNDFPSRLVEQVQQLGDAGLWVLVSHADSQRSHFSPALKRSVFGYFVASGLAGAADANRDQAVTLAELSRFVVGGVSDWVRQTTGGAAEQSPLLAWGRGDLASSPWPTLISVPREGKTTETKFDPGQAIDEARQPTDEQPESAVAERGRRELDSLISSGLARSTPSGRLGHFVSEKARQAISQVVHGGPPMANGQQPGATSPPEASASDQQPGANLPPAGSEKASGEKGNDKAIAKSEAKSDGKSDTKSGAKADTESNAKSATPASAGKSAPASQPPEELTPQDRARLAELLHRAWQLRDELLAANLGRPRPVDDAPHLWSQLEQRLALLDRKLRTGFSLRPSELESQIQETLDDFQALATGVSAEALRANSIARQIAALRPGRALPFAPPRSLAELELIARLGGAPVPEELSAAIGQLERLISTGNRTDLEKFAAELQPAHDAWRELHLVRQLAGRDDLDWRLIQLALDAKRTGEMAAAGDLAAPGWVRTSLDRADSLRLSAERQLLASHSAGRDTLLAQLGEALQLYRRSLDDLAAVGSARILANDVWRLLPDYLAWSAAASPAPSAGPTSAQLTALLDRLEPLEALLAAPDPAAIDKLKGAAAGLAAAKTQVEEGAGLLAVEQLVSAPPGPGEAWRIELILETFVPAAPIRAALVEAVSEVDAAVVRQVSVTTANSLALFRNTSLAADIQACVERARLQERLLRIALGNGAKPLNLPLSNSVRSLSQLLDHGGSLAAEDARNHCETIGSRLQDFYLLLPAEVVRGIEPDLDLTNGMSRAASLARLRAWDRARRLIDPRQTAITTDALLTTALNSAAAYDWLVWQAGRAALAAEDAPPADAALHLAAAAGYRQAAQLVPRQPSLGKMPSGPIEIAGPDEISLTYLMSRDVTFTVRSSLAGPLKSWLAIEAEEQFVEITGLDDRPIYRWADMLAGDAATGQLATAADRAARLRPTTELLPGQPITLRLRINRRRASLYPAHVVLRVVSERGIGRHDLTIALPPPEDIAMAIAGSVGRWSPQSAGVELLPYPNRVNAFALLLSSGKPADRTVDVELFPLLTRPPQGLPSEPLSQADAGRLRAEMSLGPLVAECRALALPASGEAVAVALAKPAIAAPPPPKATDSQSPAQATAPPPPAAGGKPAQTPLPDGLVAIITDTADKRQTFRSLSIAPQRPQRYVKPQVRYRAERERIEIRVSAQDVSLLPADGARLHAELLEPLAPDAERQLDGVLRPGQDDVELFAEVASEPGKVVTLALSVDEYSRAIYYRVPVSGETSDIPEDLDVLAVRIAGLPEGAIYKPPVAAVPVRLAVDTPASILKSPPLRIEAGLDRNRDRELIGDETVLLKTDRQVSASLAGIGKAGELQIDARVEDLLVELPAAGLTGERVNVLAHAILGDREAWSPPVEAVIDAQPPKVTSVALRPAMSVVLGEPVQVSALADDFGLSGVSRIEAAFDIDRSGAFGPATKAIPGTLGDDGRWSASVPTSGLGRGNYSILVRAIDRAGNEGSPARASIRVQTKEDAAASTASQNTADIIGVVNYGGAPQAGVVVRLYADTGTPLPKSKGKGKPQTPPPLAQATADDQGKFTFPKVAPGKYTLAAENLIHNRYRAAEAKIAFLKPAEVQPLTLTLK